MALLMVGLFYLEHIVSPWPISHKFYYHMQKLNISTVLLRWAKDIKLKWPLKKFVCDVVFFFCFKRARYNLLSIHHVFPPTYYVCSEITAVIMASIYMVQQKNFLSLGHKHFFLKSQFIKF